MTYHDKNTALDKTFTYETSSHNFTVKWCSLGNPHSPPLVFIHGTPWSSRVWVPFALSLSRQFHVYLFDRPGFGDSPPEQLKDETLQSSDPVVKYDGDLDRQSQVYAELFNYWKKDWTDLPHVVAHDNAGLISLRANILHHCRYASLCLIDVVAIGPFGKPLFSAMAENPEVFEKLPEMAFEGIIESYIRNAAFTDLSKEDIQLLKTPWMKDGGKRGFIREMCQANSRSTEEVEEQYEQVGRSMPIKIIWGADDDWIPVESAYRLGKALNAKEVVVIERAGHLIMFDQPGQVGVELGTWLQ